jgi:hypothetical protein
MSLTRRFKRLGDISDIDRSITVHEQAVALTPAGHAEFSDRILTSACRILLDFTV